MKKKKVIAAAVPGFVAVCAIVGQFVLSYKSVTFDLDESLIKKNPDYNVTLSRTDGYFTLSKPGGEFKVIGFTDTHLDQKKQRGDVTLEYIVRNVVNEKPDLVVFVGDNITGGLNSKRVRQLGSVMEKLGVYWTFVLGNHEGDNIWSVTRKNMVKRFAKYEHCIAEPGVKYTSDKEKVYGWNNMVLNLADENGKIVRSLYLVDGGAYMSEEDMEKYDAEIFDKNHNDYDYIKDSQMKWYKETVADIEKKAGHPVKSVVFDHIPLTEFRIAYEEITGETKVTMEEPEYNVPNENGDYIIMGRRWEDVCHPGHNSGFFDVLKETGSTDLVVSGHDHVNDFVLSYKGIVLSYNVPSGYSSYNLISSKRADYLLQGFTRYTFLSDGTYRLEQVHNEDLYPEAQPAIQALYR